MRRLGDSQLDECENPKLGIEKLTILHDNPAVLPEKRIEILDKGRIQLKERSVKGLVEILQLCLVLLTGDGLLELVKIAGAHGQVQSQILFFGGIGLSKFKVGPA